jgi:hypothetical protein
MSLHTYPIQMNPYPSPPLIPISMAMHQMDRNREKAILEGRSGTDGVVTNYANASFSKVYGGRMLRLVDLELRCGPGFFPPVPIPISCSRLSGGGRGLSVTPAVQGGSTVMKPLKPLYR